jgi:hypothetical protein
MPFDWLNSKVPAEIVAQGADKFRAQQESEIRERSALLRRLGHSRAYTELRVRRNVAWAFENAGKSPLSDTQIKALVGEIYK